MPYIYKRKCDNCDNHYEGSGKKYCSHRCSVIYRNKKGLFSGKHNPAWRGGRYKSQGYIVCYTPNHPNGRGKNKNIIFEHRLVAEKHLGRYLTSKEQIHHINEVKTDNGIENLYLFPDHWSHWGYHVLLRTDLKLVKLITKSNLTNSNSE